VRNVDGQAQADIKFGYCTEFIIMLSRNFNIKQEMDFKGYLESIGDSIVVVADEDVVKVHVHTNDPGLAIQKALKYGALSNLKIDNMRLEHEEKLFRMAEKQEEAAARMPRKEVGFLAVSVGEGVNEIFRGLGVDYIIEGGQTMNPSTADMLDAIERVNADTIFILPNNKNIILAAEQASHMAEDKRIIVIPTRTVPQGITAVINYVPDLSVEENTKTMQEEIKKVRTGQVTYAVRDTVIDDKEIRQGDYMGIGDSGILSNGTDMTEVTFQMLEEMMDQDKELIAIYYGQEISEEAAEDLRNRVEARYPRCDVELQFGGQPIYYYIISVE
ncbi:MAG: DAK2 domain-containing protein, partial [Kineothrix sp.]